MPSARPRWEKNGSLHSLRQTVSGGSSLTNLAHYVGAQEGFVYQPCSPDRRKNSGLSSLQQAASEEETSPRPASHIPFLSIGLKTPKTLSG